MMSKTLYNVKWLMMADSIDPEKWISQKKAADMRGVTRQAIHQLMKKGRFRTKEVAGKTLLHRKDVKDYEEKRGGRPPSTSGEK